MTRRTLIHARCAAALVGAAALAAAGAPPATITLENGNVINAPVIKQTSESVWVDLGASVLEIARRDIASLELPVDDHTPESAESASLYRSRADLPERDPESLARIFGDAVIKVSTPSGLGSGFIIHPDGYALTNAHVVQGETKIRVTVWEQDSADLAKRVIDDVEILAVNHHVDLALIKITEPDGKPFKTVFIHDADTVAAGQDVFAIGNPLGLERTLSRGVISTTQRAFEGLTYLQTDTQINPGNSGGPLFNLRGEVVGVTNMGIPMGEGLNFAIPASAVRQFIRDRDAFAYDKDNPNSGHVYPAPPTRSRAGRAPVLRDAETSER
ncbi:MAG: S1C family serine protease [Phycisphaerales bacterium JB059]